MPAGLTSSKKKPTPLSDLSLSSYQPQDEEQAPYEIYRILCEVDLEFNKFKLPFWQPHVQRLKNSNTNTYLLTTGQFYGTAKSVLTPSDFERLEGYNLESL